MKRLLYIILYIALAATASAQEAIDTAQFVAGGAGGTDGDEVDAVIRLSTD